MGSLSRASASRTASLQGERVNVYRNLRSRCYSIQQHGIVQAWRTDVTLRDVTFRIRKGGQRRVRETGVKNVHAFAQGYMVADAGNTTNGWVKLTYNPHLHDTFVCADTGEAVDGAELVRLTTDGMYAYGVRLVKQALLLTVMENDDYPEKHYHIQDASGMVMPPDRAVCGYKLRADWRYVNGKLQTRLLCPDCRHASLDYKGRPVTARRA